PPPADPPEKTSDDVTIVFDHEGMTIENLLTWWTQSTGRRFIYDQRIIGKAAKVHLTGPVVIKHENVDWFFEGILVNAGLALVQSGPPKAKTFKVEHLDQARWLKQRARFVPEQEVRRLERSPAQVFLTSITLRHAKAAQIRQAAAYILSNRNAEYLQETGPKSLLVCGFGPTLVAIAALVRAVDKEDNVQPERNR
ncbi:MAG: hypothetical protein CMJ83_05315, partial [Planctomycetes bacterium]|nr:hypothetical protein [Planctomycetota bacterium]